MAEAVAPYYPVEFGADAYIIRYRMWEGPLRSGHGRQGYNRMLDNALI